MNDARICYRCGHVGFDVLPRIVEVPDEVMVAVGEYEVREQYRTELRCVDRVSCDERVEANA